MTTRSLLIRSVVVALVSLPTSLGAQQPESSPEYEKRDQPVTKEDLTILERADRILSDEKKWNRHDTRVCKPSDEVWSLFCALNKASIEVLGEYQHRRAALQEVRFVIDDTADLSKLGGHRMMGFNNLPTTRFADIKRVLKTATARVAARLRTKGKPAR